MIGTCMRLKNPDKNFEFTDWGFHFCNKIDNNLKNRMHGFHAPLVDIGTPNTTEGLETLKGIVDEINGADYLTVHVSTGVNNENPDFDTILNNVSELTDYAKEKNVKVCIENLKCGFSSNPENIIKIADLSGCNITFDIGHVPYEKRIEFLELFSNKIHNVHVYEKECRQHGHIAPKDLNNLKPVLDKLLDHSCDYWLIELMNTKEISETKTMLDKYLEQHK